jgi:uncharacterized membrane protein
MDILKEIPKLIEAGIITPEIAYNIRNYYQKSDELSKDSGINRLLLVFGVLGSVLVGLGIILIVAHNWDDLSLTIKTLIAFFPLLVGQFLCGYTVLKRPESDLWRESTATFLILAVGTVLAQVSQIYHIMGNLNDFLLVWVSLSIPLMYLLRSSMASLISIFLLTWYGLHTAYTFHSVKTPYLYWILMLTVLPYYLMLVKRKFDSNYSIFHHWIIPASVGLMMSTLVSKEPSSMIFPTYLSLFGAFYLIGNLINKKLSGFFKTGYKPLSVFFTLVFLFVLSYEEIWNNFKLSGNYLHQREFYLMMALTTAAIILLLRQFRSLSSHQINPFNYVFLLFFVFFCLDIISNLGVLYMNVLLLGLGIFTTWQGIQRNHLGQLNLGLLTVSLLVILRFLADEYNFVLRGLVFMAMGIGFFVANYQIIQKRNKNANS